MRSRTGELGFFLSMGVLAIAIWAFIHVQTDTLPEPAPHLIYTASTPAPVPLSPKEHVVLAAIEQGWNEYSLNCLVAVITIENRYWDPKAKNRNSTASGLFQMLRSPSGVMSRDLGMLDQAKRGVKYIASRYENPCKALDHELNFGWY